MPPPPAALSSRWLAALAAPPCLPAPPSLRGGLMRLREASRSPVAARDGKRCRRSPSATAGEPALSSSDVAALAARAFDGAVLLALGGEEVEPPPRRCNSTNGRGGRPPPPSSGGAGGRVGEAACTPLPVSPSSAPLPPSRPLSAPPALPSPPLPGPLVPCGLQTAALAAPRRPARALRGVKRPPSGAEVEPLRRRLSLDPPAAPPFDGAGGGGVRFLP